MRTTLTSWHTHLTLLTLPHVITFYFHAFELRGERHQNLDQMKAAVHRVLHRIPQEDFEAALMSMPIRWMKCVSSNGEYFEGHHLPFDPADFGLNIVFGESSDSDGSSSDEEQPNADHSD